MPLVGKSTISMVMFNSYVTNYQRVYIHIYIIYIYISYIYTLYTYIYIYYTYAHRKVSFWQGINKPRLAEVFFGCIDSWGIFADVTSGFSKRLGNPWTTRFRRNGRKKWRSFQQTMFGYRRVCLNLESVIICTGKLGKRWGLHLWQLTWDTKKWPFS